MTRILLPTLLMLLPAGLIGQGGNPAVQLPAFNRIEHTAPDGSVSVIRKGHPSSPVGALRVVPGTGQITVGVVIDDSGEACGPSAVEHHVNADTLTITLFYSALQSCPGIITLREYLVTVTGLKPHRYLLHLYLGDIGGPGGKRSNATPWLTVGVPIF